MRENILASYIFAACYFTLWHCCVFCIMSQEGLQICTNYWCNLNCKWLYVIANKSQFFHFHFHFPKLIQKLTGWRFELLCTEPGSYVTNSLWCYGSLQVLCLSFDHGISPLLTVQAYQLCVFSSSETLIGVVLCCLITNRGLRSGCFLIPLYSLHWLCFHWYLFLSAVVRMCGAIHIDWWIEWVTEKDTYIVCVCVHVSFVNIDCFLEQIHRCLVFHS